MKIRNKFDFALQMLAIKFNGMENVRANFTLNSSQWQRFSSSRRLLPLEYQRNGFFDRARSLLPRIERAAAELRSPDGEDIFFALVFCEVGQMDRSLFANYSPRVSPSRFCVKRYQNGRLGIFLDTKQCFIGDSNDSSYCIVNRKIFSWEILRFSSSVDIFFRRFDKLLQFFLF